MNSPQLAEKAQVDAALRVLAGNSVEINMLLARNHDEAVALAIRAHLACWLVADWHAASPT